MLPTPGFHHLHLNSVDPERAIDFYTRQFPSTAKGSWSGLPALRSPNNVLVLFTRVDTLAVELLQFDQLLLLAFGVAMVLNRV